MNFDLTNEQKLVVKAAKRFAEDVCAPIAEEIDREHRFPRETFDLMSKYGILGVGFPKEFGGTGNDKIAQVLVVEELAKVCMATSSIMSIHQGMVNCLLKFANQEQKEKYIPPLINEGMVGSFALTEDNAGSDASNIQTTAVADGDYYVINGTKRFITNAGQAGLYIVLAYTEPEKKTRGITAFIVDPKTEGFSVGQIENKMGICASSTGEIVLENVRVHKDNILGKYNQGFKVALASIDDARVLTVGAQCLGVAEAALDLAVEYGKSRIQFGKPVIANQGLQWYVAEMATKIEATRYMVYYGAQKIQEGERVSKHCAMVKLYASETAREVVERSLQIHGGYGYMKDYAIERMYRDIKIAELYEGTNEIQKLVIAREVIGKL